METAEDRLARMLLQARERQARYYAAHKSVCAERKRARRVHQRAERAARDGTGSLQDAQRSAPAGKHVGKRAAAAAAHSAGTEILSL